MVCEPLVNMISFWFRMGCFGLFFGVLGLEVDNFF